MVYLACFLGKFYSESRLKTDLSINFPTLIDLWYIKMRNDRTSDLWNPKLTFSTHKCCLSVFKNWYVPGLFPPILHSLFSFTCSLFAWLFVCFMYQGCAPTAACDGEIDICGQGEGMECDIQCCSGDLCNGDYVEG